MTGDDEIDFHADEAGPAPAPFDEANALGGRMLIAMPNIGDPRFERAVILIVAHSREETMGIAVNHPVEGLSLPDLLDRLGVDAKGEAPDHAVLIGGPVERERGFVLHTDDYRTKESTSQVRDGVSLTATREVLEAMGDAGKKPRQSVLALGYANWSPGQLEQELRENVWLTCDSDEALIFDDDHATKWERALGKIGVRPAQLSAFSGRA